MFFQSNLVVLGVKAFVKAAYIEFGEARASLGDHPYGDFIVRLVLHHLVVQDELVLVFQNADLDAKLHRNTRLAFADPLGVGLEDGEDFLSVRDDFTLDHATLDLIDLTHCVGDEAFNLDFLGQLKGGLRSLLGEGGQCLSDFVEVGLGYLQIRLVRFNNEGLVLFDLFRGLGLAAFFVLRVPHGLFDLAHVVGRLPPVAHAPFFTPVRGQSDGFAHGIEQQIDVGGVVDVGLNNKGVAAPTQGFVALFFYQYMACCNNELIDFIKKLWGEQTDVVFERLEVVGHIIERAMSKHFTQSVVVVDEFVQTVVVAVQVQANDTADQDVPQSHAGATVGLADLGRYLGIEQPEDQSAQLYVGVDELQSTQNFGDVVA